MKPNIFACATKELSQDGFFTWLFQWGNNSSYGHNTQLGDCSRELLLWMIRKQLPDYRREVATVETERQWESIDICVTVNAEVLVIIEDKTSTREHSDQLSTYKRKAEEWCYANKHRLVCIYLRACDEISIAT